MLNGWHYLNEEELSRIERGIVENTVLGGPWHIELQPSDRCNLNCCFCISRPGRHNDVLDWPRLRDLLLTNRQHDLRMLRLTGGGEPLAYPAIEPLIELCGEQGILLENITTNGTLLAPLAGRIVDAGLGWLTVSLNETDPNRYARTMGVTDRFFHQAVEGVRAIVAARDAAPPAQRPRVWVQLFLCKDSARHLTEMYQFARTLNVDTIYFRTLMGREIARIDAADRPIVEAQIREVIREDCLSDEYKVHWELSQELGLHHFTHAEMSRYNPPRSENFPDFTRANPRTEYCYVGWFNTGINARGEVFPCFQYHEMPKRQIGNIYEQSLDEIWRGERYQAFRNQVWEMMRLRGRMEASDRYYQFIEHKCTQCERCHYIYNLASPDFYARVACQVRARLPQHEILRARVRNSAIWLAHRALHRPH